MPTRRLPPAALRATLACAVVAMVPAAVADTGPAHRLAVCYAPGTPLTTRVVGKSAVAQYRAEDDARWSRTATDGPLLGRGDPTTLTWSIVPDGTPIPGYIGESSGASDLRAWLTIKYGSEAQWRPIFQRVFDRWSELSGITYVYEPADDGSTLADLRGVTGVRADIRIGGHRIDGSNGTLAYNFFPDDGDMVIDTGDRYFDTVANDSRRLRNVIAHENGHGLGLDHVCPVDGTKLMEPTSSTSIDGPQLDDVLAVQRLYGDTLEHDETTAGAASLGMLPPGDNVVDDVSIDGSDDVDVYSFSALAGARVDVVLIPVGASYAEGAQNANGSCGTTTTYDALRRLDLSVELLAPDGQQRLAFADAAREGATEQIVDVALVSTQPHFVRVRGNADDVQLYRLVIDVRDPANRPEAKDDAVTTQRALPTRVDVLANDSGVTDVSLTVSVVQQPAGGAAFESGLGTIRYVPARGFVGTDTFRYGIRDALGRTSSATVSVTVENPLYAGDARVDGDDDLYPDELETRLATSSVDPSSRPATGDPGTLTAVRARALQRFRKSGSDELLLKGTLALPAGTEREGVEVVAYVGGAVRRFTLDRKGRGKDGRDAIRIATPGPNGAKVKLRLRKADLTSRWADEGLVLESGVVREYRELTAFVIVGDRAFATTLPLRYSVRNDKGKAKLLTD